MLGAANAIGHQFQLTEGGPAYRLEQRLGLIREKSPMIVRRALLFLFLTWMPLLVLSALEKFAIGHRVPVHEHTNQVSNSAANRRRTPCPGG